MSNEMQAMQVAEKQEIVNDNEVQSSRRSYMPRVNIYETSEEIVLIADMPGVDERSVDITLEKNVLTIHGSVSTIDAEGYQLVYAEYGEGDYERSFTLSNQIDQDNIEAIVSNGVLNLHLPKAEVAKAKKIAVRAA